MLYVPPQCAVWPAGCLLCAGRVLRGLDPDVADSVWVQLDDGLEVRASDYANAELGV